MKPTPHTARANGGALPVLLITAVVLLSALGVAGLTIVRALRPSGALPDLRAELFDRLELSASSAIQIKAPSLLLTAARWASLCFDIDPEARCAVRAVRNAQVGIYELSERPARQTRLELIRLADERLAESGYERTVCVLENQSLVLVYLSLNEPRNDLIEGCVVVLEDRNLVVTSACFEIDAMEDLVELASGRIPGHKTQSGRTAFAIRHGGG